MANQCTDDAAVGGRLSTTTVILMRHKVFQLLAGVVVAVFLFTAIGQAQSPGPCTSGSSYCLFISDFHNQTVQLWTDNGATGIHAFIPRNAGAGEGLSCLSGSANAIYVADYIDCYISVFNLTNGALLGQTPNFASCSRAWHL